MFYSKQRVRFNEKLRQIGIILFGGLTLFGFIGQFTHKFSHIHGLSIFVFLLMTIYLIFAYAIHAGFRKLYVYSTDLQYKMNDKRTEKYRKIFHWINLFMMYAILAFFIYKTFFENEKFSISWMYIPIIGSFISKNYYGLCSFLKKMIHFNQVEKDSMLGHK
ncbi:hypothetical protein [Acinetobacter nectaris]|uniref:hypothetical protein n=1 Tax=Acinetobacter nectaris TaxID=1219382 RepID=UPI001F2DFC7A|nr:hypothetical protein [Acinetobacter nectaris]MCF9047419.1 hypothetical protein [Acinetobacter nectaris]